MMQLPLRGQLALWRSTMVARVHVACLVLIAASTAAHVGQAATRQMYSFDAYQLSAGEHVAVNVWELDVHLRGADAHKVRVSTDLHISGTGADKADAWIQARTPTVDRIEHGLTITTARGDEGFLGLGALTRRRRIGIVLPLTSVPDVTTSSGRISIEGDFASANPLRLRTAGGDVAFLGAADSLEIRTTSGNSTLHFVRPLNRLWTRTSSGRVEMDGGARSVEIETASGDIELAGLSGNAKVETVSGNIVVQWDHLPDDASVKLRSIKGRITVMLPPESAPQGRLSTSSGAVSSDFAGRVADDGLSMSLTGDGPVLDIETASGAIEVRADSGWFAPQP